MLWFWILFVFTLLFLFVGYVVGRIVYRVHTEAMDLYEKAMYMLEANKNKGMVARHKAESDKGNESTDLKSRRGEFDIADYIFLALVKDL